MRSAKPDKHFAATDLLPELPEGIRFREAEVWAGLESALQGRRRRVLVLRWSAAAVLLLALALGWWLRPAAEPGVQVAHKKREQKVPVARLATQQAPASTGTGSSPVEIRKEPNTAPRTSNEVPAPGNDEPVLIAQAPAPALVDTATTTVAATNPAPAAPARRYRIGHINDNAPQEPVLVADVPAEERNGLIHIPITGVAGPNAGNAEPLERKPRTLMSLFKPHQ